MDEAARTPLLRRGFALEFVPLGWNVIAVVVLAAAAFAPAPVNRLAAVAGVVVLAAGIAGGILHIGLFFVPALVVLAVGGVKLWREPS